MQRIRLLSEKVANQIAAGEVVERPASIVKELVENALDAQAQRIKVEIEAGGRSLIRVTDDGMGMSRDDALLSLERHATSKIKEATDLASIHTMGFRGEALPSIASISRFTLTTREHEGADPDGTQILVNGGKILKVLSAAGVTGTTVEVRNVFYNLPARRKFLRTAETERSHIQHYCLLAALAHPTIGFVLVQEGRMLWNIPPASAGQRAAPQLEQLVHRYRALNHEVSRMIPLESEGKFPVHDTSPDPDPSSDQSLRVWGLIGAPGHSRSTRADQHLFVNQRPIENRGLNRALLEGYHTSLMKGRFPLCCLFIELDPRFVDVNVHPSKKEVKFRNEFGIRRFVTEAIRQALLTFGQEPSPSHQPIRDPSEPNVHRLPPHPEENLPQINQLNLAQARPEPVSTLEPTGPTPGPESNDAPVEKELPWDVPQAAAPSSDSAQPTPLLQASLRWLGVIGKLYVIYESEQGMVIMDQHAAHERVLFEQMTKRLEEGRVPAQRLLLPETLELNPRDAQFLKDHLASFCRLGVEISEFGEQTFLLDGLPPFAKPADAKSFALEVIDQLKRSGDAINQSRLGEEVIAKTVCRHAVKANDSLHKKELEKLLEDLKQCDMPYTCPHGRPTLIEVAASELEKKFGRVQ